MKGEFGRVCGGEREAACGGGWLALGELQLLGQRGAGFWGTDRGNNNLMEGSAWICWGMRPMLGGWRGWSWDSGWGDDLALFLRKKGLKGCFGQEDGDSPSGSVLVQTVLCVGA